MQDEWADGSHDLHADRNEGLPESRDLRAAERGPVEPELQLLTQHEGRRREGDAQLVGPEAGAAGAPEGERQFEFLEAILTISAGRIHAGANTLSRLPRVRDAT